MKHRITITAGIFLLALVLAGCRDNSLKATYFQSRPETAAEDETSIDANENSETNCSATDPHPMAESIAEKFEITYDEVMTLYCDGFAFSDILLALETTQLVDQNTEELLNMLDTKSWEEIWSELGVNPQ